MICFASWYLSCQSASRSEVTCVRGLHIDLVCKSDIPTVYMHNYECMKQTKILFALINVSNVKCLKYMGRPVVIRPDPTVTLFDGFYLRKKINIGPWSINTIFIKVFNLCYQNLESISLIVWKLWAFPQRINFRNCWQFFHHNFRLKKKLLILMVVY